MNLYLTADQIGIHSGGGIVTANELQALQSLGETQVISRKEIEESKQALEWNEERFPALCDPWGWDKVAYHQFGNKIKLAHVYAGTFSESIRKLKANGAKVTYTAAAHNIEVSKREHERLGIAFNYPHLTDPELWNRYVRGYVEADVAVCPSSLSRDCMLSYGCRDVRIIPHGVHIPNTVAPVPQRFTVGYLGAVGPDKGLIYLLQAWKKLNYQDGSRLVIGGLQSINPWFVSMVLPVMGERSHNVGLLGWIPNVADFYNQISCYVQPSCSEGFGIEVLEAMSFARPVLCSRGAGAADVVPDDYRFDPANADDLAERIDWFKNCSSTVPITIPNGWQSIAKRYTWDIIRQQYVDLWRSLL